MKREESVDRTVASTLVTSCLSVSRLTSPRRRAPHRWSQRRAERCRSPGRPRCRSSPSSRRRARLRSSSSACRRDPTSSHHDHPWPAQRRWWSQQLQPPCPWSWPSRPLQHSSACYFVSVGDHTGFEVGELAYDMRSSRDFGAGAAGALLALTTSSAY